MATKRTKLYKLTIVHLYPEMLNLYGDLGNIITLQKRCEWRGICSEVIRVKLNQKVPENGDLYFLGGGQDRDEHLVYQQLLSQKKHIKKAAQAGAIFLCLCAGFQLFGKSYISAEGKTIEGLGLLDVETRSPGSKGKERSIGNIVVKLNDEVVPTTTMDFDTLVGFENHTGQTYLGKNARPLSKVIVGTGNNSKEKVEGAVQGSIYGCYLHGLLYKNAHFADYLISQALKRKYGSRVRLKKLDDKLEIATHQELVKRFTS